MIDIQNWFAPLLWAMGVIGALVTFAKLFRPIVRFVQSVNSLTSELKTFKEEISLQFDAINEELKYLRGRTEKYDIIQTNMLRDRLVQIRHAYKEESSFPEEVYRAACDLYSAYKANGGNSYIDDIMTHIRYSYTQRKEN